MDSEAFSGTSAVQVIKSRQQLQRKLLRNNNELEALADEKPEFCKIIACNSAGEL